MNNVYIKKGIIMAVFCLMIPFCLFAQSEEDSNKSKVYRTTMVGVGAANIYDTYLSPLEYQGTDVRFISSVLRERRSEWDVQLTHDGSIAYTHNHADNANNLSGHYNFAFSMMHRWDAMDGRLVLRAGGAADLYLGFAYNMRNAANNPAQGYASLAVGGAGMATYKLRIGRYEMPICYEARLPLIGLMFSPAYGQSYYEIFSRGEYDGNVQAFSIATPSVRQQITMEFPVGKNLNVRAGYLCDIRQATPNQLRQHTYTHAFIFGFTKQIK